MAERTPNALTWSMPIALAALTLTGLLTALLLDGPGSRVLAWGLLAIPLAQMARTLWRALR